MFSFRSWLAPSEPPDFEVRGFFFALHVEILDRYMNETPGLHLKRHELDVEVSAEGETPIVAPLYQLVGAMKGLKDDAAAALVIRWASWVTDDMTVERTH